MGNGYARDEITETITVDWRRLAWGGVGIATGDIAGAFQPQFPKRFSPVNVNGKDYAIIGWSSRFVVAYELAPCPPTQPFDLPPAGGLQDLRNIGKLVRKGSKAWVPVKFLEIKARDQTVEELREQLRREFAWRDSMGTYHEKLQKLTRRLPAAEVIDRDLEQLRDAVAAELAGPNYTHRQIFDVVPEPEPSKYQDKEWYEHHKAWVLSGEMENDLAPERAEGKQEDAEFGRSEAAKEPACQGDQFLLFA